MIGSVLTADRFPGNKLGMIKKAGHLTVDPATKEMIQSLLKMRTDEEE